MSDTRTPPDPASPPPDPQRAYRPSDRFWPYAELPEEPTPERAVALARQAPEYREVGTGVKRRFRARFYPDDALELRDLFEIVERHDDCQVLVDDRAVPFARELWLPLMWLLIRRD